MPEIIAAFIGGVFALGAAVITVRWTRSRSTGETAPDRLPPTGNSQPDSATIDAPHTTMPPSDSATIDARHSGQFIATNHGTVSQTNYRDGKR